MLHVRKIVVSSINSKNDGSSQADFFL